MRRHADIHSEDCDLSISLYVTNEGAVEFWVRAGISLIGLRSIDEIDSLKELLQTAKEEALSLDLNGEESDVD
jgi:hypothetical protein